MQEREDDYGGLFFSASSLQLLSFGRLGDVGGAGNQYCTLWIRRGNTRSTGTTTYYCAVLTWADTVRIDLEVLEGRSERQTGIR